MGGSDGVMSRKIPPTISTATPPSRRTMNANNRACPALSKRMSQTFSVVRAAGTFAGGENILGLSVFTS